MNNNSKKNANKKLQISAEKVRALREGKLAKAAGGTSGIVTQSIDSIAFTTEVSMEETRCVNPTFNPDYPCLTSDCTDPFSAFCTTY